MATIKERVLQISDFKGIKREVFFSELGVSYGNYRGKAKEKALGSDVLATILSVHADISAEWLVTGGGEMLKKANSENITGEESSRSPKKSSKEDFLLDHIESLKRENSYLKETNDYLKENNVLLQQRLDECNKTHSKEGKHAC